MKLKGSKIEWTDCTFNPWYGCAKVSPGCENCYAETLMDTRFGRVKWDPQGTRKPASEARWREVLKWNSEAAEERKRKRVFCASLADVFEDRPELHKWRNRLFELIRLCEWLDFLVLTKRPENFFRLTHPVFEAMGYAIHRTDDFAPVMQEFSNVWVGVSIEDQPRADRRLLHLSQIPAVRRFVSAEPLLGPVSLERHVASLDWVIAGGESGHNARPAHPFWFHNLQRQCSDAGVAFFFKQWGEWAPYFDDPDFTPQIVVGKPIVYMRPDGRIRERGKYDPRDMYLPEVGETMMIRLGKKAAGRLLRDRYWGEVCSSAR